MRVGQKHVALERQIPPDGKEAIMSRRWFEMWNGLVLSAMFAATAWGQASQQQPSLAERMAALRRGWSGSEGPAELLERQPSRLAFRRTNRRRFGPT